MKIYIGKVGTPKNIHCMNFGDNIYSSLDKVDNNNYYIYHATPGKKVYIAIYVSNIIYEQSYTNTVTFSNPNA